MAKTIGREVEAADRRTRHASTPGETRRRRQEARNVPGRNPVASSLHPWRTGPNFRLSSRLPFRPDAGGTRTSFGRLVTTGGDLRLNAMAVCVACGTT
ncbi:hypothetical protein GCM10010429_12400 [Micromonospora olivasterospora]|uniref:Uncharacterized protein n=1 Tax=Micromonospora olivasterospora TaxID=1880 RepID=A0A562I6M5_MICOL|nr:hypothetical protein JD77_01606 [Micromonospora olivasterospora]